MKLKVMGHQTRIHFSLAQVEVVSEHLPVAAGVAANQAEVLVRVVDKIRPRPIPRQKMK
ncbi:hypothetical protein ACFO4O_06485 [Glaciecola siphonariae]|uniref:Uncharacterized protein n=1 Tax=Glaciecola siphonariae TaxID=521012 RepID=A0ABV9LWG8_9ALTE